jgi:hypothetical protein
MLQLVETARLADRREVAERRTRTFHALLRGSLHPRRRSPRRASDMSLSAVDWHHPQWFAVALLILVFSTADGLLTLMLVNRGAYEANPVMAPLVNGSGLGFALAKIAMTSAGVVVLTLLVRLRAFGRLPVSVLLYTILFGYASLIFYELWLLERLILAD